ncbi:MAG: CBS domain-containing protein [Bradyrhizobium sp.]|uniref:CBS domain-containing protein n=1 Tax=Bradyrhizobium sp. TaxID=376 RepID=UPI0025C0B835|nr:CBS domain-containing protein [Bradyrhizobium sp.]MBI5260271.1 CBS domain-containing protein [Bradyrhizobium sp.]
MRAHQIMSRQVITIGPDASVADAIDTMLAHHISGLPVVDKDGRLVGILSEGDFIRRAEIGTERKRGRWLIMLAGADRVALDFVREHGRKVQEIMTEAPVTIREDTSLEEIAQIMELQKVKRVPVMRDDRVVGIVTRSDFLPAIARLSQMKSDPDGDDEICNAVVDAIAAIPWGPRGLNVTVTDGIVTLRGVVRSENVRKAAVVAAENVPGVRKVEDLLSKPALYPAPEDDYGGGDIVSLQEEPSTTDDEPL